MDLVVVFLKEVHEHMIVPENYIYDLNIKKLKNYGTNTNQDFLVFWSSQCIEGQHYPMPNPSAECSKVFPPNGDAWYKGRTLYFTNDIEEAREFRNRKRKILPAVYNQARIHETPIPELVIVSNQENVSNSSISSGLHEIDPLDTSVNSVSSNTAQSFVEDNTVRETTIGIINILNEHTNISNVEPLLGLANLTESEDASTNTLNQSITKCINDPYQSESTTTELSNFFDHLGIATKSNCFMEENQSAVVTNKSNDSNNVNGQVFGIAIKEESPFMQLNNIDLEAVENVFHQSFEQCTDSDDDVMICKYDEIPMPVCERPQLNFEVKNNDIVSGTMAYAKGDDDDRFYMVSEGNTWKGITLTKRVVDGLTYWNSGNLRNAITYDKRFVKVAMVSCIGVQNVKENQINNLCIKFIKDLFAVRVNGDPNRFKTFENLFNDCATEISANNFD